MARFQKREYHEDKTEKHVLTTEDVAFLSELQKELNTQPNMGNADPLYWGIAQIKETPTSADFSDKTVVVDADSDVIARSLEQFAKYLDENDVEGVEKCTYFNGSCTVHFADGDSDGAYDLDGLVEALDGHGIEGFEIRYVLQETEVVRDEVFLTHKDCEEHLEAYGYNYKPDAHAYAMTAVRSPRYEKLLKIIRTVDWSKLRVSGTGAAG